jgi:hypothetical protein
MPSSSPRWVFKIRNSVQPRVVRHYDEFASAKRDSGADGVVVPGLSAALVVDRPRPLRSCRHILESHISENYFSIAPKNRGGSGRAGSAGPPFPCSELGAW